MLEENEVTCPLHGATFDVTTGKVTGSPAVEDVVCYEVRITGNDIEVKKRDTQQTENSKHQRTEAGHKEDTSRGNWEWEGGVKYE